MNHPAAQADHRSTGETYLLPFLCIQGLVVLIALWREGVQPTWLQYDWEINYSAGFVRRGFYGEILRQSHLLAHAPTIVAFTILVSYIAIFIGVRKLGQLAQWSPLLTLLVYSPAALGFTLLSPNRIGCKDVLFVALLTLAATLPIKNKAYAPTLAVAATALILVHEVAAFYFPYLFVVVWFRSGRDLRRAIAAFLGTAVLGAGAFLMASTHKGSTEQANTICRSIGGSTVDVPPCDGAIRYLTVTSQQAHQATLDFAKYFHFKVQIPFILILSLFPVAMLLRALLRDNRKLAYTAIVFLLCSWAATLPLFWFATDWDRWIYMHIFSTTILALLLFQGKRQEIAHAETLGS